MITIGRLTAAEAARVDVRMARGGRDPAAGFGAAIRDRRRLAGLTQRQLAEAAAVSVAVIRDLEQDRTACPREASLLRLCTVLDLNPDLPGDAAGAPGDHPPPPPNGTARPAGRPGRGAVRLSVLGPLGAWHGAEPVQLGGPRQRAVLALLTLQPNAVLHRDAIIEALWPADPPASAVKMVQAYIGQLRRQLDPGRAPRDRDGVLVSAGTHYRLRAGADQLDVIAFGHLADRARAARRAGDAAAACELFASALGLWHGEPLADLDLLAGHPAVAGLDRRRAAVVHEFAETAVGAGLHDRALPHLEALAERDPLDERAHACLMIALAGTGRQAAALSLYERLRRRLDEQLGVHPGPALAQAHTRVLRQDVAAADPGPPRPLAGGEAIMLLGKIVGLLEVLADAHLAEETRPGRFRLHDLLHAYAAEQAQAADSAEAETLRDLGDLSHSGGDSRAARQAWGQALAIAEELGDPHAAAIRARLGRDEEAQPG